MGNHSGVWEGAFVEDRGVRALGGILVDEDGDNVWSGRSLCAWGMINLPTDGTGEAGLRRVVLHLLVMILNHLLFLPDLVYTNDCVAGTEKIRIFRVGRGLGCWFCRIAPSKYCLCEYLFMFSPKNLLMRRLLRLHPLRPLIANGLALDSHEGTARRDWSPGGGKVHRQDQILERQDWDAGDRGGERQRKFSSE